MNTVLNQPVADFDLPGTDDKPFRLSATKSGFLVIYFYPKDNTPGCTTEGSDFRDLYADFRKANCEVVGISRDSVKSHNNFRTKLGFPFHLLADEDEKVCSQFGVIKMKNMYGKKVRGIERSTFVVDRKLALRGEWRGVKVAGHVREVLDFVRAL